MLTAAPYGSDLNKGCLSFKGLRIARQGSPPRTQGSDSAPTQDNAAEKAAYVSQPRMLIIC